MSTPSPKIFNQRQIAAFGEEGDDIGPEASQALLRSSLAKIDQLKTDDALSFDKDKGLFSLLKPSPPPKTICFREQNEKAEDLDWKTLQEKLNVQSTYKVKAWAGNYYLKNKEDLKKLQEIAYAKYHDKYNVYGVIFGLRLGSYQRDDGSMFMTAENLRVLSNQTMECIQLVHLNNPLNTSAFAKTKISQGSVLIYGGLCKLNQIMDGDYQGGDYQAGFLLNSGLHAIDAEEYRDFSGWIAHLPEEKAVKERLQFKEEGIKRKLAKANFCIKYIFVVDLKIIVPALVAIRDIEANEILGYDYGDQYWPGKKLLPTHVDTLGNVIDRSLYQCVLFKFSIRVGNREKIGTDATLDCVKKTLAKEKERRVSQHFAPGAKSTGFLEESSLERLLREGEIIESIRADGVLNESILNQFCEKLTPILNNALNDILNLPKPTVKEDSAPTDIQKNWRIAPFDKKPLLTFKKSFPATALASFRDKIHKMGLGDYFSFFPKNDNYFIAFFAEDCYLLAKKLGIHVKPDFPSQKSPTPPTAPKTTEKKSDDDKSAHNESAQATTKDKDGYTRFRSKN